MFKNIIFLCLCLVCISCDRSPPKVRINLDLPPKTRWVDVCLKNKETFKNLVQFAERAIIPKPLTGLVNAISKHFDKYIPADLLGEMQGMASTLDIDIGVFALFNILYDLTAFERNFLTNMYSGCTSIVAQDLKGRIWLARNLDYGQIGGLTAILRNMTLQVEYTRKGEVVFTSTTYAGLVGIFTAQKPKLFTMSINERGTGSILDNAYVLLAKNYTFTSILGRQVVEQASSYEDAVTLLTEAITPGPSYFIMGGVQPGQGAIVTRDRLKSRDVGRLNATNGTWFLVETNYDHWMPTPKSDNRRDLTIKAMHKLGQNNVSTDELLKVLSIYPVLNSGTTYTTIMSAGQPNIYRSIVRDYTL